MLVDTRDFPSTENNCMKTPSNESLITALHEAARDVGFFSAAEGDWTRESTARQNATARWGALKREAQLRGIYNEEEFRRYWP